MIDQLLQVLVLLVVGYFAFRFAVALKRQREKEAEGVKFSGPFAYFTDAFNILRCIHQRPLELSNALHNDHMRDKDGKLPDVMGFHLFGTMGIFFNKPKYVEELLVTKNAYYSKHELQRLATQPLFGATIASLETDHPLYKKKRKALSAAFFKCKMSNIAQTVKQVALETFADLQAKGDENVVCIYKFTCKVQAHIIVSQLVGSEYCFKPIVHINLDTGEEEVLTIADFMD